MPAIDEYWAIRLMCIFLSTDGQAYKRKYLFFKQNYVKNLGKALTG